MSSLSFTFSISRSCSFSVSCDMLASSTSGLHLLQLPLQCFLIPVSFLQRCLHLHHQPHVIPTATRLGGGLSLQGDPLQLPVPLLPPVQCGHQTTPSRAPVGRLVLHP